MTRRPTRPARTILAIALNLAVIGVVGLTFAHSFAPFLA
jgi:hypothetical protein